MAGWLWYIMIVLPKSTNLRNFMYKLKNQNLVILGSLNPAIVTPSWLIRAGLIKENDPVDYKFPVGAVMAPVRMEYEKFKWEFDYNRLQLSINEPEEFVELGGIINAVFKDLKFTPVRAFGQNFEFAITEKTDFSQVMSFVDLKVGHELSGLGSIPEVKNEITLSKNENEKINVKITDNKESLTVFFNYHREVKDMEELLEVCGANKNKFEESKNILNVLLEKIKINK